MLRFALIFNLRSRLLAAVAVMKFFGVGRRCLLSLVLLLLVWRGAVGVFVLFVWVGRVCLVGLSTFFDLPFLCFRRMVFTLVFIVKIRTTYGLRRLLCMCRCFLLLLGGR